MVYVTGDMHGDPARLSAPALRRLTREDTLLVCGDFGFIWDGGVAEQKLLRRLGRQKYTIAFLDGRHENFSLLAEYPVVEWHGGRAQQINERVYHLLRGEIYTIEEHTYFTFGGGESDDRDYREPGVSWWPEEMPTEQEMRHALDVLAAHGNQVDCILTHVPSLKASARLNPRQTADGVSLFLGGIENTVTCEKWFFGSLHRDKAISQHRRAVFEEVLPVWPAPEGARHARRR